MGKGLHAAALVDGGTPVQQADGGLLGRCAQFKPGQSLHLPRRELGPLYIHGKDARVILIAWVHREANT